MGCGGSKTCEMYDVATNTFIQKPGSTQQGNAKQGKSLVLPSRASFIGLSSRERSTTGNPVVLEDQSEELEEYVDTTEMPSPKLDIHVPFAAGSTTTTTKHEEFRIPSKGPQISEDLAPQQTTTNFFTEQNVASNVLAMKEHKNRTFCRNFCYDAMEMLKEKDEAEHEMGVSEWTDLETVSGEEEVRDANSLHKNTMLDIMKCEAATHCNILNNALQNLTGPWNWSIFQKFLCHWEFDTKEGNQSEEGSYVFVVDALKAVTEKVCCSNGFFLDPEMSFSAITKTLKALDELDQIHKLQIKRGSTNETALVLKKRLEEMEALSFTAIRTARNDTVLYFVKRSETVSVQRKGVMGVFTETQATFDIIVVSVNACLDPIWHTNGSCKSGCGVNSGGVQRGTVGYFPRQVLPKQKSLTSIPLCKIPAYRLLDEGVLVHLLSNNFRETEWIYDLLLPFVAGVSTVQPNVANANSAALGQEELQTFHSQPHPDVYFLKLWFAVVRYGLSASGLSSHQIKSLFAFLRLNVLRKCADHLLWAGNRVAMNGDVSATIIPHIPTLRSCDVRVIEAATYQTVRKVLAAYDVEAVAWSAVQEVERVVERIHSSLPHVIWDLPKVAQPTVVPCTRQTREDLPRVQPSSQSSQAISNPTRYSIMPEGCCADGVLMTSQGTQTLGIDPLQQSGSYTSPNPAPQIWVFNGLESLIEKPNWTNNTFGVRSTVTGLQPLDISQLLNRESTTYHDLPKLLDFCLVLFHGTSTFSTVCPLTYDVVVMQHLRQTVFEQVGVPLLFQPNEMFPQPQPWSQTPFWTSVTQKSTAMERKTLFSYFYQMLIKWNHFVKFKPTLHGKIDQRLGTLVLYVAMEHLLRLGVAGWGANLVSPTNTGYQIVLPQNMITDWLDNGEVLDPLEAEIRNALHGYFLVRCTDSYTPSKDRQLLSYLSEGLAKGRTVNHDIHDAVTGEPSAEFNFFNDIVRDKRIMEEMKFPKRMQYDKKTERIVEDPERCIRTLFGMNQYPQETPFNDNSAVQQPSNGEIWTMYRNTVCTLYNILASGNFGYKANSISWSVSEIITSELAETDEKNGDKYWYFGDKNTISMGWNCGATPKQVDADTNLKILRKEFSTTVSNQFGCQGAVLEEALVVALPRITKSIASGLSTDDTENFACFALTPSLRVSLTMQHLAFRGSYSLEGDDTENIVKALLLENVPWSPHQPEVTEVPTEIPFSCTHGILAAECAKHPYSIVPTMLEILRRVIREEANAIIHNVASESLLFWTRLLCLIKLHMNSYLPQEYFTPGTEENVSFAEMEVLMLGTSIAVSSLGAEDGERDIYFSEDEEESGDLSGNVLEGENDPDAAITSLSQCFDSRIKQGQLERQKSRQTKAETVKCENDFVALLLHDAMLKESAFVYQQRQRVLPNSPQEEPEHRERIGGIRSQKRKANDQILAAHAAICCALTGANMFDIEIAKWPERSHLAEELGRMVASYQLEFPSFLGKLPQARRDAVLNAMVSRVTGIDGCTNTWKADLSVVAVGYVSGIYRCAGVWEFCLRRGLLLSASGVKPLALPDIIRQDPQFVAAFGDDVGLPLANTIATYSNVVIYETSIKGRTVKIHHCRNNPVFSSSCTQSILTRYSPSNRQPHASLHGDMLDFYNAVISELSTRRIDVNNTWSGNRRHCWQMVDNLCYPAEDGTSRCEVRMVKQVDNYGNSGKELVLSRTLSGYFHAELFQLFQYFGFPRRVQVWCSDERWSMGHLPFTCNEWQQDTNNPLLRHANDGDVTKISTHSVSEVASSENIMRQSWSAEAITFAEPTNALHIEVKSDTSGRPSYVFIPKDHLIGSVPECILDDGEAWMEVAHWDLLAPDYTNQKAKLRRVPYPTEWSTTIRDTIVPATVEPAFNAYSTFPTFSITAQETVRILVGTKGEMPSATMEPGGQYYHCHIEVCSPDGENPNSAIHRQKDKLKKGDAVLKRNGETLLNVAYHRRYFISQAVDVLTRLDGLSYMVLWCDIDATDPDFLKIELPRLNCKFGPRPYLCVTGEEELRLASFTHQGAFVANTRDESLWPLLSGLSHAVLLENEAMELFVLMAGSKIRGFSTKFLTEPPANQPMLQRLHERRYLNRAIAALPVKKHHAVEGSKTFFLSIHPSREFLLPETLESALYVVYLKLCRKQYDDALRYVEFCQVDRVLTVSEIRVIVMMWHIAQDSSLDNIAVLLKLTVALNFSTMFKEDFEAVYHAVIGREIEEEQLKANAPQQQGRLPPAAQGTHSPAGVQSTNNRGKSELPVCLPWNSCKLHERYILARGHIRAEYALTNLEEIQLCQTTTTYVTWVQQNKTLLYETVEVPEGRHDYVLWLQGRPQGQDTSNAKEWGYVAGQSVAVAIEALVRPVLSSMRQGVAISTYKRPWSISSSSCNGSDTTYMGSFFPVLEVLTGGVTLPLDQTSDCPVVSIGGSVRGYDAFLQNEEVPAYVRLGLLYQYRVQSSHRVTLGLLMLIASIPSKDERISLALPFNVRWEIRDRAQWSKRRKCCGCFGCCDCFDCCSGSIPSVLSHYMDDLQNKLKAMQLSLLTGTETSSSSGHRVSSVVWENLFESMEYRPLPPHSVRIQPSDLLCQERVLHHVYVGEASTSKIHFGTEEASRLLTYPLHHVAVEALNNSLDDLIHRGQAPDQQKTATSTAGPDSTILADVMRNSDVVAKPLRPDTVGQRYLKMLQKCDSIIKEDKKKEEEQRRRSIENQDEPTKFRSKKVEFHISHAGAVNRLVLVLLHLSAKLRQLQDTDREHAKNAQQWAMELSNSDDENTQHINGMESSPFVGGAGRQMSEARRIQQLRLLIGEASPIHLMDLARLLMSTVAEKDLQARNIFLSNIGSKKTMHVTMLSLLYYGRISLAARCILHINEVVRIAREAPADKLLQEVNIALSAINRDLNAKRWYVTRILPASSSSVRVAAIFNPRYLFFEFLYGITLWNRQLDLIQNMHDSWAKRTSTVFQLLMGQGKSSVVAPIVCATLVEDMRLLNLKRKEGEVAGSIVVVVPRPLLRQTRHVLGCRFSQLTGRPVFGYRCERTGGNQLALAKKVRWCAETGGILLSAPEYLKATVLRACETGDRHLLSILQSWRRGMILADEVDVIMNPLRSELNFPIGSEVLVHLGKVRWRCAMLMLNAAYTVLQQGIQDQAVQTSPHLTLVSKEWYKTVAAPIVAERVLAELVMTCSGSAGSATAEDMGESNKYRTIVGKESDIENGYQAISPEALSSRSLKPLSQYLCGDESTSSSLPQAMKNHPLTVLIRRWLKYFVPHCLSKVNRVSYGFLERELDEAMSVNTLSSIKKHECVAIPFLAKDVPARQSEFSHPDVVIGFTYLAFRHSGLRPKDVYQVVSHLVVEFNLELHLPAEEREAHHIFESFFGEGGSCGANFPTIEKLKLDDRKVILDLHAALQFSQITIEFFLDTIAFPNSLVFPQSKLSASSQEIGNDALFPCLLGFTGTSDDLVPSAITVHHAIEDTKKVLRTLGDPCIVHTQLLPDVWDVETLLQIAGCEGFDALVDPGGLVTGISNKEAAERIIWHQQREGSMSLCSKEATVFLDEGTDKPKWVASLGPGNEKEEEEEEDEEGNEVIEEKAKEKTAIIGGDLISCSAPLHKRFVFFDQVHCTGVDITQSSDAKAAVTVGKDMTLRDLAQALWRMRKLGQNGQSATLLIPPQVYRLMLAEVHAATPGQLSKIQSPTPQLVATWLCIQGARRSDMNEVKLLQQEEAFPPRQAAIQKISASSIDRRPFIEETSTNVPRSEYFSNDPSQAQSLDAEVVQESEQEKILQKQYIKPSGINCLNYSTSLKEPIRWQLDHIHMKKFVPMSDVRLHPDLASFLSMQRRQQPHKQQQSTLPLYRAFSVEKLSPVVQLSENFLNVLDAEETHEPSKLRSVHCILQFLPGARKGTDSTDGNETMCVAISLTEADALRRVMTYHRNLYVIWSRFGIPLTHIDEEIQPTPPQSLLPIFRFFNSDFMFTMVEVKQLRKNLKNHVPKELEYFYRATGFCRHRGYMNLNSSPLSGILFPSKTGALARQSTDLSSFDRCDSILLQAQHQSFKVELSPSCIVTVGVICGKRVKSRKGPGKVQDLCVEWISTQPLTPSHRGNLSFPILVLRHDDWDDFVFRGPLIQSWGSQGQSSGEICFPSQGSTHARYASFLHAIGDCAPFFLPSGGYTVTVLLNEEEYEADESLLCQNANSISVTVSRLENPVHEVIAQIWCLTTGKTNSFNAPNLHEAIPVVVTASWGGDYEKFGRFLRCKNTSRAKLSTLPNFAINISGSSINAHDLVSFLKGITNSGVSSLDLSNIPSVANDEVLSELKRFLFRSERSGDALQVNLSGCHISANNVQALRDQAKTLVNVTLKFDNSVSATTTTTTTTGSMRRLRR